MFEYPLKWCAYTVTALFDCYRWNCCCLVHHLCTPCNQFSFTSHKATYVWCMRVCMLWSGGEIINVINMLFCCNLPPALLEEWPGSLMCCCGNTGVEQVPNWESAQKVDPGEENSHATSAWTRTHDFFYHEFGTLPLSVFTISIFNYEYVVRVCVCVCVCASFPTLFVSSPFRVCHLYIFCTSDIFATRLGMF